MTIGGVENVIAKVLWSMITAVRLGMETSAVTTMVLANWLVNMIATKFRDLLFIKFMIYNFLFF